MIDTHSHIYSEEFDTDREQVIQNAIQAGVTKIILPAIDSESFESLSNLAKSYPNYCYPAIGLHPTSVKENFREELKLVRRELEKGGYIALGEIGIDLYWDKSFLLQQQEALRILLQWAIEFNLPVIMHLRDSFKETLDIFREFPKNAIKGVFHSFTGSVEEGKEILDLGEQIFLGINGIVTFKNSGLASTLAELPIERIVLETDAPFLAPTPHRGKRNEPSYLELISRRIAEVYGLTTRELDEITTKNALKLFSLE